MTFIAIILLATLVSAVWLAADLLRPGLEALLPRGRAAGGAGASSSVSYEPIGRLLAESDFAYLADEQDLADKLLKSRTSAMRLYVKQIRHHYLEVWTVCKLLAPISPDPAFASQLSKQYWRFHWAYVGVQVQCMAPAFARRSSAAGRLVQTLAEIREQANSLLAVSENAMAASAAAA